jgi:hypothetical protein
MYLCKTSISLLLLSCTSAWCQVSPHHESADPTNGSIFVGAAFTSNNPANGTVGIGGGASFHVYRMLEIAGEVDSYIGSPGSENTTTLLDYLVGPRISFSRNSRLSPFADFMAGGQSLHNSSTQHSYFYANGGGAALAGDGGVDVKLTRHLAVRAEAGIIHSNFATPPTTTWNNSMRAGSYLLFRF